MAPNDVNLVGIMCCEPEDIVLVAEKDAPRALEALQRMLKERSVDTRRKDDQSIAVLGDENATPVRQPSLQTVTP